jgi:hypothetical protein
VNLSLNSNCKIQNPLLQQHERVCLVASLLKTQNLITFYETCPKYIELSLLYVIWLSNFLICICILNIYLCVKF